MTQRTQRSEESEGGGINPHLGLGSVSSVSVSALRVLCGPNF